MLTRERIENTVAPLQQVARALGAAASDVARRQPVRLEVDAFVGAIEDLLAVLLEDPLRRAQVLDSLSRRASRDHALLVRLMSGDTAHEPGLVLIELAQLAAAIRGLPDLLDGENDDRAAA